MLGLGLAFGRAGGTLGLARVDGYDYALSGDGATSEDDVGEAVPTGLLEVTMMNREGTRSKIPFAMPMAGSSAWMGSLPEIGTTCIVGFFEQQDPVIIGFLPKDLSALVGSRRTIPNLQPGEVYMQASSHDADVDGNDHHFVGASVHLDGYGRIIIRNADYKCTIGFLLSNEGTPDVTTLKDPITGEAIYFQETMPGGTSRRVGAEGSTVWSYAKDKVERVGGNVDVEVDEEIIVTARRGQVYKDKKGNEFKIDADGNVFVKSATGSWTTEVQGTVKHETAGDEIYHALQGYRRTVGGDHHTTIAGTRKLVIGQGPGGDPATALSGDVKVVLGAGGSQEHVVLGAKLIAAQLGIALYAPGALTTPIAPPQPIVTPGAISLVSPFVFLGGPAAVNPVAKFTELAALLTTLVTLLTTSPTPVPGLPLLPGASALSALIAPIASTTAFALK